jgi:hypothetical protein
MIETLDEARAYYQATLVRAHPINCHGRPVTIVFEAAATHLYSESVADWRSIPAAERVDRKLGPGRIETRQFSLRRAWLMDQVLPAITLYTVSTPGTRANRMLHGQRLASGEYMRVILNPGPGSAFTCVSAYPVAERVWREACLSKRARFPP